MNSTATESLTEKSQACMAAQTLFKRHEAWGWHLLVPFVEGASETEKATIQAGVDRYNELRTAWEVAKRAYDQAKEVLTNPYHKLVRESWQSRNANFRVARSKFRRFAVKDGLATFVVAKDGANYEGLSMKVEDLLMPGLKLWASILQVPYASRMTRTELEKVLQPVLAQLRSGAHP